jgi:hypothetical protein
MPAHRGREKPEFELFWLIDRMPGADRLHILGNRHEQGCALPMSVLVPPGASNTFPYLANELFAFSCWHLSLLKLGEIVTRRNDADP